MSRLSGLIVVVAVVIALLAARCSVRTDFAKAAEGFDGARAFKDLERLVALGPRPPGSQAIEQARHYICSELSASGAQVQREPFIASTPDAFAHKIKTDIARYRQVVKDARIPLQD